MSFSTPVSQQNKWIKVGMTKTSKPISSFLLGSQITRIKVATQSCQDWEETGFAKKVLLIFTQVCKMHQKSGSIQPNSIWKRRTLAQLHKFLGNSTQFVTKWKWFCRNRKLCFHLEFFRKKSFNENLFNTACGHAGDIFPKMELFKKKQSFQKKVLRSCSRLRRLCTRYIFV